MSKERVSALVTLRSLLLSKLQHHQQNPSNFYRYSEGLRGAASLAQEVAASHDDEELLKIAADVLFWVETRGDDLAKQSDVEHRRQHDRLDAARALNKSIRTAVKGVVGMEYVDERWDELVRAYQAAFPTFIVRSAVHARLHPRKRAASLRIHLDSLIHEQKQQKLPTAAEVDQLFPQALKKYEQKTLQYLERALPGYDFHAEWDRRHGDHR